MLAHRLRIRRTIHPKIRQTALVYGICNRLSNPGSFTVTVCGISFSGARRHHNVYALLDFRLPAFSLSTTPSFHATRCSLRGPPRSLRTGRGWDENSAMSSSPAAASEVGTSRRVIVRLPSVGVPMYAGLRLSASIISRRRLRVEEWWWAHVTEFGFLFSMPAFQLRAFVGTHLLAYAQIHSNRKCLFI